MAQVLRDYNSEQYAFLEQYDDGRWDWARVNDIPINNKDLEVIVDSEKMLEVSFNSGEIPSNVVRPLDSSYALRNLYSEAKKYADESGAELVTLGTFGEPVTNGMIVEKQNGKVTARQKAFFLRQIPF
jgi:hypothetical protein